MSFCLRVKELRDSVFCELWHDLDTGIDVFELQVDSFRDFDIWLEEVEVRRVSRMTWCDIPVSITITVSVAVSIPVTIEVWVRDEAVRWLIGFSWIDRDSWVGREALVVDHCVHTGHTIVSELVGWGVVVEVVSDDSDSEYSYCDTKIRPLCTGDAFNSLIELVLKLFKSHG